jgi:hypothetical protein
MTTTVPPARTGAHLAQIVYPATTGNGAHRDLMIGARR